MQIDSVFGNNVYYTATNHILTFTKMVCQELCFLALGRTTPIEAVIVILRVKVEYLVLGVLLGDYRRRTDSHTTASLHVVKKEQVRTTLSFIPWRVIKAMPAPCSIIMRLEAFKMVHTILLLTSSILLH